MDPEVLERRYQRERNARHEAERLLEEKSRELYALNEELTGALDELQSTQSQLVQNEKMASIGQMAAGVAHEINNPIGFIASNLSTLRDYVGDLKGIIEVDNELIEACGGAGDGVREAADAASRARTDADFDFLMEDIDGLVADSLDGADRIKSIVADMRDFSHVDNPDVADADLNDLIDKTISVAAHELKYKAEIIREYDDGLGMFPCYGGRIGQVILNLLINAAHAIEKQGTITVRTGGDDATVWFEIEDTGCGMSEEVAGKIFDPFFTTKAVGKGTGLGLHLSRNILAANGGTIAVRSRVGEGTTFRVELPKAGPPEADGQAAEAA